MKKNFFLMAVLSLSIMTASYAQVSTTPEVPRNYKPQPKELIPMPGELTEETIFPVLGKYEFVSKTGETSGVTITRDAENKGIVWVSGLPQGKFRADLKASPATYKIPVQKTLQNDVEGGDTTTMQPSEVSTKRYSGKSVQEGTLIYDNQTNKLYVNLGSKFKEDDPAYVFPELLLGDTTAVAVASSDADASAKPKHTKAPPKTTKGKTYILNKTSVDAAMTTPPATTTETQTPPATTGTQTPPAENKQPQ